MRDKTYSDDKMRCLLGERCLTLHYSTKIIRPVQSWRHFSGCAARSVSKGSRAGILLQQQLKSYAKPSRVSTRADIKLQQQLKSPTKSARIPGRASAYQTFAETLANKSTPTVLYEGPSPTLYITGCYVISITCLFYAGFNLESAFLHPPEDLSKWIPPMVGGACVATTVIAAFFAFKVCRLPS